MGRMMAASLMTWCLRCDRARSSTRTCQRWNVTASASTTRARTRAESDRSRSSTSKQSWGHHSWSPTPPTTTQQIINSPSGSNWHAHSSAPSFHSHPARLHHCPHTLHLDLSSSVVLSQKLLLTTKSENSTLQDKFGPIRTFRTGV